MVRESTLSTVQTISGQNVPNAERASLWRYYKVNKGNHSGNRNHDIQYKLLFEEMFALGLLDRDHIPNGAEFDRAMQNSKLKLNCLEKYGLMWMNRRDGNIKFTKIHPPVKDQILKQIYANPEYVKFVEQVEKED